MREVDIVFISFAKDEILRRETCTAVNSLFESEDPDEIKFNVFIVESNPDEHYIDFRNRNVTVIHPDVPFGYHRYLNIGRKAGNAEYVVLCNNDLTFEKKWASIAIQAMEARQIWSAGCCNPNKKVHKRYIEQGTKTVDGWGVAHHVTGWIIFQKREIYEHIGDLDEDFEFWYCDNDYSMTLKTLGFYHMLIVDSRVYHHDTTLGSTTKRENDYQRRQQLTHGGREIFDRKWSKKKKEQK